MIKPRLPQKSIINKVQPRDMFQTPNYAAELLVPFIPVKINNILEPACGDLKLSSVLENAKYIVYSTDIKTGHNFLTEELDLYHEGVDCIITNPPYSLKRQFFKKCIEYDLPFALLISGDYSLWTIDAVRKFGCEKVIPDHRIDYITPTGLSGKSGHTSYFHSYWLTRYFHLGQTETFVELTKKMKENI